MDHAKALADALETGTAIVKDGQRIAPQDFYIPAEAATRENGDLVARVEKIIREQKNSTDGPDRADWQLGYAAACRELRDRILPALSTHQQQGADYAQGFYDGWMRCGCFHIDMNFEGREEEKANIAARLPRAPQPDTVTEAYNGHDAQHHVALVLHGKFGAQCGMGESEMWVPVARAAIEALAARGKAG